MLQVTKQMRIAIIGIGRIRIFHQSTKFSSKDFSKKKRANRSAKLKQCQLDARIEQQWLSPAIGINWDQINGDVLEEIVKRINLYENFVTCSCVCTPWRSAATKENFNNRFRSNQMPWLMLSPEEGNIDHLRSFYSLSRGKSNQIVLKEASDHKCFSSKGWLLTINKKLNISLLDPFSRFHIELPHMNTFGDWVDDNEPLRKCAMFINKCFFIWDSIEIGLCFNGYSRRIRKISLF
ncbi:hypothetical protein Dsin_005618 [Dipteronia sinensis]|uniref:F-box domain-containing protein n=1 Tax=Dipteronia sinensis TaxID=43782 RepID=A0AAE0EEV9_9ROSI|nr:hypothetical protein Dsin_005618 [Dipteronia sinensis]